MCSSDLGVSLFEIGHVYPPGDRSSDLPPEYEGLAVALAGRDATAAMAVWREIVQSMGFSARVDQGTVPAGMHPTRSATLSLGKDVVGAVGEIHPDVLDAFGVTERVAWLELDLTRVLGAEPKPSQWKAISRFPSNDIDLAFVAPDSLAAEKVEPLAIIERLYVACLARKPTPEELEGYKPLVAGGDVNKTLEDLQTSLKEDYSKIKASDAGFGTDINTWKEADSLGLDKKGWDNYQSVSDMYEDVFGKTPTYDEAKQYMPHQVTSNDVTSALKVYLGKAQATPDQLQRYDFDGDGKVDLNDVTNLQKRMLGKSTSVEPSDYWDLDTLDEAKSNIKNDYDQKQAVIKAEEERLAQVERDRVAAQQEAERQAQLAKDAADKEEREKAEFLEQQAREEAAKHQAELDRIAAEQAKKAEEDRQAEEIQQIFERNHMFPAKSSDAQGHKAKPGMVTYISGCNNIAGHGTSKELFDVTKEDLNRALHWHDTYFANEKGVDGGFILAFGRLYAEAREQGIEITQETEDDLYRLFQCKYGTPAGFHRDCKARLKSFQEQNKLKASWSDSCLTPILVLDYLNWKDSENHSLPEVNHMTTYAGI